MFFLEPNWLIFYIGLGLIILELFLGFDTGFDFLLVGLALMVGAIGGFITGNYLVAIVISIIISILYILLGRKYLKKKLHISTHKTNIDALIGKEGEVVKPIKKGSSGQVKVENEIWRAQADRDFSEKSKVKIVSVEGVTVKVT